MGLKGKAKEILGLMRAKIFGVTAGQNVYIGKHCSLKGKRHITLEASVTVRPYTQIGSGGTVRIGKGSEIGESVIVGNVKIGKHCVIGANSVVTKDVPDYCVAVGSPARVIKKM